MRVALIADVHGNSLALDAVVAALDRVEPDEVVFLGDAVANGYDPRGCLERLQRLDARLVMGNTDADILSTPDHYHPREAFEPETQRVLEISLWGHEQLTQDDRDFVERFEATVEIDLPGNRRLVCFHGSPRSATEVITAETRESDLEPMLGERGDVLAGGHTHVRLLRTVVARTLINPGSVGLAFSRYGRAGHVPLLPVAQYAIIDAAEGVLDVAFREVPLDIDAISESARDSGMPHADWWASQWTT